MINLKNAAILGAIIAIGACKQRDFNTDSGAQSASASEGVTLVVNSKLFNAYNIWQSGEKKEISQYPGSGYGEQHGAKSDDGVFYVASETYLGEGGKKMARRTAGAKVAGDVLVYPVRDGRQLKLKFSIPEHDTTMTHAEAVVHCRTKGGRLPTVRELFDFCQNGICKDGHRDAWWSASLDAKLPGQAWIFDGDLDYLGFSGRLIGRFNHVRCVIPE